MKNTDVVDKFEKEYSSRDILCDAMSMAKNENGEYEQSLARLCYKWFCKGMNAAGEPLASTQLNTATETCVGISQFVEIVRDMRLAQKQYFETRSVEWLNKSKLLERAVDAKLESSIQGNLI